MRFHFIVAAAGWTASVAQAGIIYETSFERPGHVVGVLPEFPPNPAMQDNWFQPDGSIFSVTNNVARGGTQSVTANTTGQPNASRWALRQTPLDGSLPENTVVTSTVWVRLDQNPDANRLTRAGIDIYDGTGATRIGALSIQSDGLLRAFDGTGGSFNLAAGVALGVWHQLSVSVNYATMKVAFYFNGSLSGMGNHNATDFGDANLWMVGFLPTGTAAPIGHQAYFDDYSIAAIPGPGTLVLGFALAVALRRRR